MQRPSIDPNERHLTGRLKNCVKDPKTTYDNQQKLPEMSACLCACVRVCEKRSKAPHHVRPPLCVSSVGSSQPLLQKLSKLVQLLQASLLTLTARTTLWMVLCRHSAALKAGCFSWFRQQQRWDLSAWFGFAMKGELEMAHPRCYRAVCSQLPCHTSCRHAPPPEHDGNVSLAFGLWVQGRLPFLAFCKYWRQNCAHTSHCILTVQLGVRISHCSCGHWTGSHI